jgi:hypothetical protein
VKTATELVLGFRDEREARERKRAAKRQQREWAHQQRLRRSTLLAEKIDSAELIVLALSFYAHRVSTQWTPGEEIETLSKGCSLRLKRHLQAARRVLLVQWRLNPTRLALPANWIERVNQIGIDLNDPDVKTRFDGLPESLEITNTITELATLCPDLVPRTQAFLCGDRQQKPTVAVQPAKHVSWWVKAKAKPKRSAKHLSELLETPSQDDTEDCDGEPDEPKEADWSREKCLRKRIRGFLGSKS